MKKSLKILHWLPRVICIFAILFVSLFALDAFDSNLTIWQQVGGFLIHLIPSFILTAILIIAWKWEYVGGIIFTVIGFGLSPFVFIKNYEMNNSIWMSLGIILVITIPFVVVGILFMISHFKKKRENL
ncbi:MAG: hypothetical protein Q7U08_08785 [Flavobacteriaceae bacterium]|nr:hypothetical protein [Flavobacteriaceae bacterium]